MDEPKPSQKLTVTAFADYIFNVSVVLLSASKQDIVSFKQAEALEIYHNFIHDSSQASIFIYRTTRTEDMEEDKENLYSNTSTNSYNVVHSLKDVQEQIISAIVVIKQKGILSECSTWASHLQIANLPVIDPEMVDKSTNSFESLRAFVNLGIAPYFDTLSLNTTSSSDGITNAKDEEAGTLGVTRKKIRELALSLQHLQQTVQIPDLTLGVHPTLKQLVIKNPNTSPNELLQLLNPEFSNDSKVLNDMQSTVNKWVKLIQDITQLDHDLRNDKSAQFEINFWFSLESALTSLQEQLKLPEILLTLNVLKQAKRFHATISFLSDTGIQESTATAVRYNALLKDLPLDEILSATSIGRLEEAIILVFNHLKKLRVTNYPIGRAITLVEAISSDVAHKLGSLISELRIMAVDSLNFTTAIAGIQECFNVFDSNVKEFTSLARELLRKRNEKFILVKVDSRTVALHERIDYIVAFRQRHSELVNIVEKLDIENELAQELRHAYSAVESLPITDLSVDGMKRWNLGEKLYKDRISKVQNAIVQMLRHLLSETRNSNEVFEIFEKFRYLLTQDYVRNAIQEYQSQLLTVVKGDIKHLQAQFLKQNEITKLFRTRDIPPVSSTILWARQIEQRLKFLIDRCELILGPNWQQYPEGQKVQAEATVFQSKLNTQSIFDAWLNDSMKHTDMGLESLPILKIVKNHSTMEVIINFDHSVMNQFKEVRHLCLLDYDVPHKITSNARTLKKIYPQATGISESLQVWKQAFQDIQQLDELSLLLQADINSVTESISILLSSQWGDLAKAHDLSRLRDIDETHLQALDEVKTLNEVIYLEEMITKFSFKVNFLQTTKVKFNMLLSQLTECPYEFVKFGELIQAIQELVNDIVFEAFSHIDELVTRLNTKIESILMERCAVELKIWCAAFEKESRFAASERILRHEIVLRDQLISVIPPIQSTKKTWYEQIHQLVNIARKQRKVYNNASLVDAAADDNQNGSEFFAAASFYAKANECIEVLEKQYAQIDSYVKTWKSFQSLWDLEVEDVSSTLSQDLDTWIPFFQEFRASKETFDTVDCVKSFGVVTINYEHVQARINSRYDVWQMAIVAKLAEIYGTSLKSFHSDVVNLRQDLEKVDLRDCVSLILTIDKVEQKKLDCNKALKQFKTAEAILTRVRFRFNEDWLHIDQIDDEYSSLLQITTKRRTFVDAERSAICSKLDTELEVLSQEVEKLRSKWATEKPISGDIVPSFALSKLEDFDNLMISYNSQRSRLLLSMKCIGLEQRPIGSLDEEIEEIVALKSVWISVDSLWIALENIKAHPWSTLDVKDTRHQLDKLLSRSRELPVMVRQYVAFESLQNLVKDRIKTLKLIADLKHASLKEHHWTLIFKSVINTKHLRVEELTLGAIWEMNLTENEPLINDVISQANGEKHIEEEMNKIEANWREIAFEFFNFHDRVRLVKKWDVLFQKCNDDLNSLTSMQHSIHYRVFEARGSHLMSMLNRLFRLLDTWIETQKEFIYVDGVFGEGTDIRKLLPMESSRFENVSNEFFLLMKHIFKSSIVIDALNVPDVQKSMERVLEMLQRIKKSLTEYLEKQRELFPRFYLIGSEDLLEIIGNSTNPLVVSKHFSKLFAGVSGVICEDKVISGVTSHYGEILLLQNRVDTAVHSSLNGWLNELEAEIKSTLSKNLSFAITDWKEIYNGDITADKLAKFISNYQAQLIILAVQVTFTNETETAIVDCNYDAHLSRYVQLLRVLAHLVLKDTTPLERRKYENLVIEFIYHRRILSNLNELRINSTNDFAWRRYQRYYYENSNSDFLQRLAVKQGLASFSYGFEYLGVQRRLVNTPLMDNCFLSMTQALHQKMGGSPFGPAGTGKTESIKALGQNLGKMVLVFCCDESFDYQAIGRILSGVCQIGAWACFDEFNRLEEKILSAVSTQLEQIESSLSNPSDQIRLLEKPITVSSETGVFITMNPGYAGRSELPENLKKLFRSFSMTRPDSKIITEVLLNSQGFTDAQNLASQIVPFVDQLRMECSQAKHYDFGLRALKNMLICCGVNKRKLGPCTSELDVVLSSINETIAPRLVNEDERIFEDLEARHFGRSSAQLTDQDYTDTLKKHAERDGIQITDAFLKKSNQLVKIQETSHGIILYGASGTGKTTLWKNSLKTLSSLQKLEATYFVIDCKVMTKASLYGNLDPSTCEWVDGVLTAIIRKIKDNLRGELSRITWIVFDCDIDPEWIENLNSVLDDNKSLTLPNGERLALPENVRFIFEVDNIMHATPATISRCGVVYISDPMFHNYDLFKKLMFDVKTSLMDNDYENDIKGDSRTSEAYAIAVTAIISQTKLEALLVRSFHLKHIMPVNHTHILKKLQIMLKSYLRKLLAFGGDMHHIAPKYASKAVMIASCWAFAGDCSPAEQAQFSLFIGELFEVTSTVKPLIEYDISLPEAELALFSVASVTIESHEVNNPDIVIPTQDTAKHEDLIYSVVNDHNTLVMCGPPGSGKTMTLLSALRKAKNVLCVDLNFSKETTPQYLVQVLEQHCDYKKTAMGVSMSPKAPGKWLVIFADEINLPRLDKYNTATVISLLRGMIEHRGFFKGNEWVSLVNVQFVGACNPSSDSGRNELSMRFVKNVMTLSVDYPNRDSLYQIYETMMRAVLGSHGLRHYASDFTHLLIESYERVKEVFAQDIFSPRDISRLVRGIQAYLEGSIELNFLLRLFIFNALRVYSDRLPDSASRESMFEIIKAAVQKFFQTEDNSLFKRPLYFTNWTSLEYAEANEADVHSFISGRLRTFCEEEIDADLILFDDLLDHVLRIDRVLKQPQGHMILVGASSSGKTTLTRFTSWMNGFKSIQLSSHRNFTLEEFDEQLKRVLRLATVQNEKISFIVDETNVSDSSFLERMNNLLSSCEIPGLFDADELKLMMSNWALEESEFSSYFKKKISENLHVIFTMSAPSKGINSSFLSSPALVNRCVVNWMGDWSQKNLLQVANSSMQTLPLDNTDFRLPEAYPTIIEKPLVTFRDALLDCSVFFHTYLLNSQNSSEFTPGHFVKFIKHFVDIFTQKEDKLQQYQKHINLGLDKLKDTVIKVRTLKEDLSEKQKQLQVKDTEANDMLGKMLFEQNEAERKQEASIEIQKALKVQEQEIELRRQEVMSDLSLAEPAVIEAARGVKNIKKEHLNELRAMRNPPDSVILMLESVCDLLGYETRSWRDIQLAIRSDTFISDIVNFDNEGRCSSDVIDYMEAKYLSRPDYNYETANRGSKACGPLLQWVKAQLSFAAILDRVSPLKEEVEALEAGTIQTRRKLSAIDDMISELEASIEKYKLDYSQLIRDTEHIKTEVQLVKSKIERSVALVNDLTGEKERWTRNISQFHQARGYLAGDSLLSAAFLSYCGNLDQRGRATLIKTWKSRLVQAGIYFDPNYTPIAYLSSPEEHALWSDCGISQDELFMENMIITSNSPDHAFIIDPSGKLIEAIAVKVAPRKLVITSFLDAGFVKHIENALRFGNAVLVQDAEYFDPIIRPILSKEFQRVGNRTLVELNNHLIDYMPGFELYLFTKDPSMKVTPFISSRATVVNFTITESSLISQTANMALKAERPEVESRRTELVRLEGEYKLHLQKLESDLLDALSSSEVDILENDEVMTTLQTLKAEAKSVSMKAKETAHIMMTVNEVLDEYFPFASISSTLFDLLQSLKSSSPFYQFPLEMFNETISAVLSQPANPSQVRIEDLRLKLFQEVYGRISLSLLNRDRVIVGLVMFALYHDSINDLPVKALICEITNYVSSPPSSKHSLEQICNIFSKSNIQEILKAEELSFIKPLMSALTDDNIDFSQAITDSTRFLVPQVESVYNTEKIVRAPEKTTSPIVMVSPEGYDASFKIAQKIKTVAMGSSESISSANSEILKAAKEGTWLLVQNVQMVPQWLEHLETLLQSLTASKGFKLFLTCNLNSKIPVTLLRASDILVFENPPGIKAIIKDAFDSVKQRLENTTVEKRHLYFLLSFFHAVVQERVRYIPVGFKKKYDFNNTDFNAAVFVIDEWIAEIAGNKANVNPQQIPWHALQVLIGETIYGGKADNLEDYEFIQSLIKELFTAKSFEPNFKLAENLHTPEERSINGYSNWISGLPDTEHHSWLRLNADAESAINDRNTVEILQKVKRFIV